MLDVSNEVAAELAGVQDGVLDALRERLDCTIGLRGNRLVLGGADADVAAARAVVDELVELVEGGHQIGPDTVGAVLAALDQAEDVREVFDDVISEVGATNIRDMGRVMAGVMHQVSGRADGSTVSQLVKEKLA